MDLRGTPSGGLSPGPIGGNRAHGRCHVDAGFEREEARATHFRGKRRRRDHEVGGKRRRQIVNLANLKCLQHDAVNFAASWPRDAYAHGHEFVSNSVPTPCCGGSSAGRVEGSSFLCRRCRPSAKLIVADVFFLLGIYAQVARRSWHLVCNCVRNDYAESQSESGSDEPQSRADRSDTQSESRARAHAESGADTSPQSDSESECRDARRRPPVNERSAVKSQGGKGDRGGRISKYVSFSPTSVISLC